MKHICLLVVVFFSVIATLPMTAEAGIAIKYYPPNNAAEKAVKTALQSSMLVEDIIAPLARDLELPYKLTLHIGGDDGPLYDPRLRTIIFPYRFIIETNDLLAQADYSGTEEEIEQASLDVFEFTIYHELAHALVDILELPVLGKEEDAADTLATILILATREDGVDAALAAADHMAILSDTYEIEEADYWDEHSLDIQRAYHIICMVYGSAPETLKGLLVEVGMSEEERGGYCIEEFEIQFENWINLLDPYLKPEPKGKSS